MIYSLFHVQQTHGLFVNRSAGLTAELVRYDNVTQALPWSVLMLSFSTMVWQAGG